MTLPMLVLCWVQVLGTCNVSLRPVLRYTHHSSPTRCDSRADTSSAKWVLWWCRQSRECFAVPDKRKHNRNYLVRIVNMFCLATYSCFTQKHSCLKQCSHWYMFTEYRSHYVLCLPIRPNTAAFYTEWLHGILHWKWDFRTDQSINLAFLESRVAIPFPL